MEVIHKQIVDEQHTEVQQLLAMRANSIDELIRAIEKWETAEVALENLLNAEEAGGIFESTVPVQTEDHKPNT